MLIIDAHMHLWQHLDGRFGTEKVRPLHHGIVKIGPNKIQAMPTWFVDCRNPAELALAAFDDTGVCGAVVTQEFLDGNQNDYLLQIKKKYPARFFVHALLDFRKPSGLKAELARVVKQGFRGIKCPAMGLSRLKSPVRLDQPELMEVWQTMQDRRMILSIDLAAGDEQVPQMEHIIETFPRLKIAIGHFGMVDHGNWKAQIRLARYDNVRIECGGIIWLFRHEDTAFPQAQARLKKAASWVGVEKLMWGSDYPRTMVDFTYRQSVQWVINGCPFWNDLQKHAFLAHNAVAFYGFKGLKGIKPCLHITEL